MSEPQPTPPPTLDYAVPWRRSKRSRVNLLLNIGFAVMGLGLIISILLPSTGYRRGGDSVPRVKCASNLRQIGQAILLYANENSGRYPNDLPTLILTEEITSEVFVCPSTNDIRATGATTQAVGKNMALPGHLSYIYLGKGLNVKTVAPNVVVAYEPLSNHANTGSNVLFGDGHVDFIFAPAIKAMETKLQSTPGPTTLPDSP